MNSLSHFVKKTEQTPQDLFFPQGCLEVLNNITQIPTYNTAYFKQINLALKNIFTEHTNHFIEHYQDILQNNNTLFTSFAISKAEYSSLTLTEARAIQKNQDLSSFAHKIADEIKQTQKEYHYSAIIQKRKIKKLYEKLEFANISNTLSYISQPKFIQKFKQERVSKDILLKIHTLLTQNLDSLFLSHNLPNYYPYFSGKLRNQDSINVGGAYPLSYKKIPEALKQIRDKSFQINEIADVFGIHGGLYYSHFFFNGNKRVARIIEHLLLQIEGFNPENVFSSSVGYFLVQDQYINTLFQLIKNKDLARFTHFSHFALINSILFTVVNYITNIRQEFIQNNQLTDLKILEKQRPVQYKFLKQSFVQKTQKSEVSFVEFLKKKALYLTKSKKGKNTYYDLNIPELRHAYELLEILIKDLRQSGLKTNLPKVISDIATVY